MQGLPLEPIVEPQPARWGCAWPPLRLERTDGGNKKACSAVCSVGCWLRGSRLTLSLTWVLGFVLCLRGALDSQCQNRFRTWAALFWLSSSTGRLGNAVVVFSFFFSQTLQEVLIFLLYNQLLPQSVRAAGKKACAWTAGKGVFHSSNAKRMRVTTAGLELAPWENCALAGEFYVEVRRYFEAKSRQYIFTVQHRVFLQFRLGWESAWPQACCCFH